MIIVAVVFQIYIKKILPLFPQIKIHIRFTICMVAIKGDNPGLVEHEYLFEMNHEIAVYAGGMSSVARKRQAAATAAAAIWLQKNGRDAILRNDMRQNTHTQSSPD